MREAETQAEGEAGSLRGAEPDAELDPRTLGSQLEPKVRYSTTKPPRRPPNDLS